MKPGDAGLAQAREDRRAVAAAEDLVDVAHRHERASGSRGVDAPDELDRPVERRARCERDRGSARWSVAPSASGSEYGQPDLEQVGAGIDERERDRAPRSPRPG